MMIMMFSAADMTMIITGDLTDDTTDDTTEDTIEDMTGIFLTLGGIINTHIVTDTEDVKILFGGCSGLYSSHKICKFAVSGHCASRYCSKELF
jgi:hypothetical protein